MIFYINVKEEDIKENIERMRDEMERTDYRCAFGYAMKHDCDSVEDAIRESDYWMYKNKAQMKAEKK